jgi:Raf kinase inhibitor-like YbhB/YbcL family protein
MQLTSAAFPAGAEIPSYYTSDGDDVSPELSWKDAPKQTKSFALIMHDPDAPRTGGFTHWVVYNIDARAGHIAENVPDQKEIAGVRFFCQFLADFNDAFGPFSRFRAFQQKFPVQGVECRRSFIRLYLAYCHLQYNLV